MSRLTKHAVKWFCGLDPAALPYHAPFVFFGGAAAEAAAEFAGYLWADHDQDVSRVWVYGQGGPAQEFGVRKAEYDAAGKRYTATTASPAEGGGG